jgi:Domain of unknown function (DUF4124)
MSFLRFVRPPLVRLLLVAGVAGSVAMVVQAQAIQRCEGADGRVTYSNSACPSGTRLVREVDTSPAVSPGEQKAAPDRARRDAKALNDLESTRTTEEKAQQRLLEKARAKDEQCTRLRLRAELARDQLDAEKVSNRRPPLQGKYERAQKEYTATCPKR